jgi:hypothetical protein
MRKTAKLLLLVLLIPATIGAWGEKGHLMINRMAIDASASKLPEFMAAGRNQLIYDAYEPDRWREEAATPLATAQAADHFLDSEYVGAIMAISAPDRFAFMEQLAQKKLELVKVGYLPYAMMETYGKMRNAFRMWRNAKTPEDREAARVNALVYAGTLGHYVGDGSNPLHLTYHYNGWDVNLAPNPKGYTTARIHSKFETLYVNTSINIAGAQRGVKPPVRLANVFTEVKTYLDTTFKDLEPLYQMEKDGEFNPDKPQPKGTEFIERHLARAATMLGNLWYTAWMESGEPAVPPRP